MLRKLILPLVIALTVLHAQPAATSSAKGKATQTRIGRHRLGETLEEWLAAENLGSPKAVCRAKGQSLSDFQNSSPKTGDPGLDSAIEKINAQNVEYETMECSREMAKITSAQLGNVTVDSGDHSKGYRFREYQWQFAGRRLVKLTIKIPGHSLSTSEPDSTQEIKSLIEAYGAPTESKTIAYQNSYTRWDCAEATWTMPDGIVILAQEYIRITSSGPRRSLDITFTPKEFPEGKELNPYIH